MHDTNPLILIGITMFALWFSGKLLARSAQRITNVQSLKRRAQILKKTSLEFMPGLNVGGLDVHLLAELQQLVAKKDEIMVALFLAVHRPLFFEIEDLIEKLKEQFVFLLGGSIDDTSEFDKISAANSLQIPNHPQAYRFKQLNKTELRMLYEADHNKAYVIDKELIDTFGGVLFMENFIMYDHLCREQPAIFHIPEDNELRRLFNTFVRNGIAVQGKEIPLQDRLHVLDLAQLQQMAKEVKLDKEFNSKSEAVNALSHVPSASVVLATIHPTNELFLLTKKLDDVKTIEKEWLVLNAYAKLICVEKQD